MSFLKQTGITLFARFTLVLVSFIFNIIISRKLGTDGMSIIAPLQTFAVIGLQIGYLGLERSAVYYIGIDPKRVSQISGTLMTTGIVSSVLVYGGFTLAARLFPQILGIVGLDLYQLQLISVLPLILNVFGQNLLLFHQKIVEYNVIEVGVRIVNLIATVIVFWLVDPSLWILSMIWLYVLSAFATGFLNTGFAWKASPFGFGIDWSTLVRMFTYSWKNYVSAFMIFMIVRSDIIFLNAYRVGTDEAGIYSRVVYISDLFFMIPLTMGMLLFPKLMHEGASEKSGLDERGRFTMLLTRLVIFILFIMWITFAIIGKWFLGIFGAGFVAGYIPMVILLFGIIFIGAHAILKVELFRRGLPVFLVWYTVFGIIVKLTGNWLLVPDYGMQGAAVSSVVTHLIFFSCALWYCVKHYGYTMSDVFIIKREDFEVIWERLSGVLGKPKSS